MSAEVIVPLVLVGIIIIGGIVVSLKIEKYEEKNTKH